MIKKSMRVVFQNEETKFALEDLAQELGLSLNTLVNHVLEAELSDTSRKTLQLLKDIAEYQKYIGGEIA